MGKNNKYYKTKDKNLTLKKRNGKLNKSISLTLAGMSVLSLGAIIQNVDKGQEASAMRGVRTLGPVVKSTLQKFSTTTTTSTVTSTVKPTNKPITSPITNHATGPSKTGPATHPSTSSGVNLTAGMKMGAPGAINSGRGGNTSHTPASTTSFKSFFDNKTNSTVKPSDLRGKIDASTSTSRPSSPSTSTTSTSTTSLKSSSNTGNKDSKNKPIITTQSGVRGQIGPSSHHNKTSK